MIKHVVMWKLKDKAEGHDKKHNLAIAKKKLAGLRGQIGEITSLTVGENFNPSEFAADLVLITSHRDRGALNGYINHAVHREVAAFIGKIVAERRVVDFEDI